MSLPFSSADSIAIGYFNEEEERETETEIFISLCIIPKAQKKAKCLESWDPHLQKTMDLKGSSPGLSVFWENTQPCIFMWTKRDQVRKRKALYMPSYSCLTQGKTKRCYLWLEVSSWMITCGLLRGCSQVCPPPPTTGRTGPCRNLCLLPVSLTF